jgi:DNA gyrase subunit A
VFTTTTHHWLLVFTNKGKVYRTKVHEVPESSRTGRGTYVANLPGWGSAGTSSIAAVIDIKEYDAGSTSCSPPRRDGQEDRPHEYDSPRTGLAAINLKDGDELIGTLLTDGKDDLILVSKLGQASGSARQCPPHGPATGGRDRDEASPRTRSSPWWPPARATDC